MATTIRELKAKINEKNEIIKNLRGTINGLAETHRQDQMHIKELENSAPEAVKELLGVYLKYITEQHGTEQYDDDTGKAIGKMFAFTFQEKNDNVFNMMPIQDEEGRLSMVCSSTYPIEEGEDE